MSDNPMLNKMDALLKKHRGQADNAQPAQAAAEPAAAQPTATQSAAPPNAWLPVLTQVIERGTPPVVAAPVATPATPAAVPVVRPEAPAATAPESSQTQAATPAPVVDNALAEQLMSELAPRLSEVMEKQVATELRKNLDQTVATLLSQLDVNVREIVRDAVAEKLKQPRDPSS